LARLKNEKELNMKRLQFAAGLLMALAFSGLQAQTMQVRATVPFEFRVGGSMLPAGTYTIQQSDALLILRPYYGGKPTRVLTISADLPKASRSIDAGLQFHRYGDSYFFETIWAPGYSTARAVPQSPLEKELARRGSPDENPNIVIETK
jgi:hypothetical protein